MKIAIGCDPNALEFKNTIMELLGSLGHTYHDFGSEDPIYANVAVTLAKAVVAGEYDRGILICGTGLGVSIAANKVKGARVALLTDCYQAQRAQLSNNANIIALGAQVTGIELAKCLVQEYLNNTYNPNSRSAPKVDKISEYEAMG